MDHALLATYERQFGDLNPNTRNGRVSPHKPVLLLSVIQLIGEGRITSNRIYLTDTLIDTFADNWVIHSGTDDRFNYAMPFFHMGSRSFWKLVPNDGKAAELETAKKKKDNRSRKRLKELVDYALIDQPLLELLQNRESNERLAAVVINTYFPQHSDDFMVLSESPELLVSDTDVTWEVPIREQLRETKEHLVPLRNARFRHNVLNAYHYRCAISGLHTTSLKSKHMLVQACHIRPFAHSETESVSNGIALTPTLHAAFDAGFITIDEHFCVKVSSTLIEEGSPYELLQFDGKKIFLPASPQNHPSIESLKWHWENRFIP